MDYQFDNDKPIYLQMVEVIKKEIISGRLKCGEKIPSVREIAYQAKVNPNTVQKALSELERCGLVYTERTNGKFVTENKSIIKEHRDDIINDKVESFLKDMIHIGVNEDEIMEYLDSKKGLFNSEIA